MIRQIVCKNCGSKDVKFKYFVIENKEFLQKVVILGKSFTINTKETIEETSLKIKLFCSKCNKSCSGMVVAEEADGLWLNIFD
jgi:hypothetical protein